MNGGDQLVQRALPTLSTGILRTGAVYPGQPDDSSVLINQLILTDRQGKGHTAVYFPPCTVAAGVHATLQESTTATTKKAR